jgi:glycerol kinase
VDPRQDDNRARAERGELLFGTVDSYLIWRLTGGRAHVTDATNACRTMLYNIHEGRWDEEICRLLGIPAAMLPEVRDSATEFGETRPELFGRAIPILGVAGDQQAATCGQACFEPGMLKSTYGTGCFALLNTGETPVTSRNRLLGTIAYQLDGKPTYALEGSIFIAGAVVQWLRDGLKLIREAAESQTLAEEADEGQDVYLVPGLHRPRRALLGPRLPRRDLRHHPQHRARRIRAGGARERGLPDPRPPRGDARRLARGGGGLGPARGRRHDGVGLGHAADRRHHRLARRPAAGAETTALGAAWLAGMRAGLYPGPAEFARGWALERRFEPRLDPARREARYAGWRDAVSRTLSRREG